MRARDTNADILLPADLGQIRIDDLQLRDAPTDLALEALSAASGNQFVAERHHSGIRAGNPLYIIRKNEPPGPPAPERTVQALNLTGYLSYMNLDVLYPVIWARQAGRSRSMRQPRNLKRILAKLKEIIERTMAAQQEL